MPRVGAGEAKRIVPIRHLHWRQPPRERVDPSVVPAITANGPRSIATAVPPLVSGERVRQALDARLGRLPGVVVSG
jgi:hypothetical protein